MTTISSSPPPETVIKSANHSNIIIPRNALVRPAFGSRLHYIPIALFLFFPATFLLCYFIALTMGHINAFFAFISDAGTLPPEQNVFAQLVNVGAALFAYFVYIRYVQVEHYMKRRYRNNTTISNVIALAFGFTSSLGMSLVGNFPELVKKEVHLIGAFLAFVGGSIYSLFQGYFTFKLLPHFQSKCVAYMRIFLGILGLMLYFGAQSTIIVAFQRVKNKEKLENKPEALKWKVEDGGYNFRAASVIMEWLLLVIFDCFVITFVSEFKQFKLTEPNVTFVMDISEVVELANLMEGEEIGAGDLDSEFPEGSTESQIRIALKDDYSFILDDDSPPIPIAGGIRSGKLVQNKYSKA